MIRDEELEDIDLLTEDIPVEAGGDGQLYEHFHGGGQGTGACPNR